MTQSLSIQVHTASTSAKEGHELASLEYSRKAVPYSLWLNTCDGLLSNLWQLDSVTQFYQARKVVANVQVTVPPNAVS